jgi:hypothetical protein
MQTPAMVGPNGEPLLYGRGPYYHPVAYRPYPGSGYSGHYNYRDGRANGRNGPSTTDW